MVARLQHFPAELASYIRRPLDIEHSEGIQFRSNISSKPTPPTYTHNLRPGEISSTHFRNAQVIAETSNQLSRKFARRVPEPDFLGPQWPRSTERGAQ